MTDDDQSDPRADRLEDELQEVVRLLDGWAVSARRSDDGIVVELRGGRPLRILLTPDRLDDFGVVGLLSAADVADMFVQRLRALPDDARYLVFSQYDMVPSRTPVLHRPPMPPPGSGRWVVTDREGGNHYYDGGGD